MITRRYFYDDTGTIIGKSIGDGIHFLNDHDYIETDEDGSGVEVIIDPNSNLIFVIKKLSKFVGESIPIVNKKNNEMIGIISENDVLQAYLDISEEINQIEKH